MGKPPVVLLVGWSGSGKTTLVEKLVQELTGRGLRLATVKHDAHGFDVDQPGKDTWRHRQAGAVATAISSPEGFALIESRPKGERPLEQILPLLSGVDLILVEGYKAAPHPKIEVVGPPSSGGGEGPSRLDDPLLFAVAADQPVAASVPRFARNDVQGIAEAILRRAGLGTGRQHSGNQQEDACGGTALKHKFDPSRMARLESQERRRTLSPEKVFEALRLAPGETFLDLGCGPGFFALPAAEAVGSVGRVLAVDLSDQMVERVRQRAQERGFKHVAAVRSEESRVPLPDGAADALLISNVLHEAEEPRQFLREAYRLLRPGGRLAIVEWKVIETAGGPPLEERLAPETVLAWLESTGFEATVDFEPGTQHYGLVARRA